jgi:uncharacterized pyridoxal phosphate-containing UPF0001 family protein
LQVNIDDQDSKSGCQVAMSWQFSTAILPLPNVVLRGLMIIPQAGNHQAFTQLAQNTTTLLGDNSRT